VRGENVDGLIVCRLIDYPSNGPTKVIQGRRGDSIDLYSNAGWQGTADHQRQFHGGSKIFPE
jgi:hypothetical protein